jgi:hypothetical protein
VRGGKEERALEVECPAVYTLPHPVKSMSCIDSSCISLEIMNFIIKILPEYVSPQVRLRDRKTLKYVLEQFVSVCYRNILLGQCFPTFHDFPRNP